MADISNIDYDTLVSGASQIASKADEMQNKIKSAFDAIEAMSEHWFGNSYDNFINVVNMSITNLNKMFEITVSDIPHEIYAKAKSYAYSQQTEVSASFTDQTALTLTDLAKTNKGTKLRFQSENISADQTTINGYFEDAATAADEAKTIATSLKDDWKSISGDTNIAELKTAFNTVETVVNNLKTSLSDQITAQEATISALETAADAVEAAKDAAESTVENVQEAATNAVQNIKESASQLWTNLTGGN